MGRHLLEGTGARWAGETPSAELTGGPQDAGVGGGGGICPAGRRPGSFPVEGTGPSS